MIKAFFSKPYAGILTALVVLVVIFGTLNPTFLTMLNIQTILRAMSYTGIIAFGMGLCLISGVIDISVGATSALASVAFGSLLVDYNIPLPIALAITLAIGSLVGAFNSFIILRLHVSPFIATLSSMFMVKGIALAWNKGFLIYPLPDGIATLGTLKPLGVSLTFIFMLAVMVVAWIILERTVFGIEIRATGSDLEVAKCTEVRYRLVHFSLLMGVGTLAAASGIFLSFVLNAGAPNVGEGWEFIAITACAIGGVSLFGFEGSIPGIFLGVLVIQVLANGLVMIGVSAFFQQVVIGAVLLGSIILDVKRRNYLNLEKL